jgi:hypothetical protein
VENYLIGVAKGVNPPVDKEVAQALALHLGVPFDISKVTLKQRLEAIDG